MSRLGALILAAGVAWAQPVAKPLRFEVASVKSSDPNAKNDSASRDAGEGLDVKNITVRNLITLAYDLRDFQLAGGPGWINSDRYDVVAKAASGEAAGAQRDPQAMDEAMSQRKLRFDRVRERLRSLLADRFGLMIHRETRDHTVYLLTIARNGPKLKEVSAPEGRPRKEEGRGFSQGFAVPMEMLVTTLANGTHTTVVDKTGLMGRYDYKLEWAPDFQSAPAGIESDAAQATVDSLPTIFTAVMEQLGLRLEAGKAPVDVLVVDRVGRPSEN
jgi:uncharacterized protein (TIGR03435 family)